MAITKEVYKSIVATIDDEQKIVVLTWDKRKPKPSTGRLKYAITLARGELKKYQDLGYVIRFSQMEDEIVWKIQTPSRTES